MTLADWLFAGAVLAFLAAEFLRTKGQRKMSAATDRLAASVAALTTSVDALIAKPVPNDDAVVNAQADAVDALKAKVDAAVNPHAAAAGAQ